MSVDRQHRKEWAREHFRGFENVLIPSFSADFRELNEAGIRLDVKQSIRHGFFSTLCAMESGLTMDEKKRMLSIATDEAGDDIGVSLSLVGETLEENMELLQFAESVGATHGLLCYSQDFRPQSQDEVYEYVKALAEASSLGIVLFVSDKFSLHHLHVSGVPFDAYEKLADVDNVIAMKVGGMDAGLMLECFDRFNDRLLVTSTNFAMLPMLVQNFGLQWSGAWTVEAVQSPEKPYAIEFLDHLRNGRFDEAMLLYWKLAPALGAMMSVIAPIVATGAYPWPMMKYQQWLSGGNGGMTRNPCMRMFQRDMQRVRGGLEAIGVECADPDAEYFLGRTGDGRNAEKEVRA